MSQRFTMVVAAHVLLEKDGQFLLARRFKTGYEDGNFSLPAGHVEIDESCRAAAAREAEEEVAVKIELKNLELAHVMHRRGDRESIDFFFISRKWEGTPKVNEPEKCNAVAWYHPTNLPPNTIAYIRQAITKVIQGEKYSEFGF